MKRFAFRLARLLGLREQEEELSKLKLGHATRISDEIKLSIENLKGTQRSTSWSSFDPAYLFAREAFLARLAKERKRLESELEKAEKVRQKALGEYMKAHQHAEVLRKYRERRMDDYRREIVRNDDNETDDILLGRINSGLSGL